MSLVISLEEMHWHPVKNDNKVVSIWLPIWLPRESAIFEQYAYNFTDIKAQQSPL